ncbi:hypothetical protein ACFSHP_08215 [Novosphingobium panipatense]
MGFFDRFAPLGSQAAGRYAVALSSLRRADAATNAVAAWRKGSLIASDEAALLGLYRNQFTPADHDARMDVLLWQGETAQAERQISFVSSARRPEFMERLTLLQGSPPGTLGLSLPPAIASDPGYVYNRAVQARRSGNAPGAITLLANRPALARPVPEPQLWVRELLTAARGADAASAVKIAASIDDAFAPGTDVSRQPYRVRDDYTSLVWLGGTKALWSLRNPRQAAPLFYRYGAAAQTPGTRSKGFYWAGRALAMAGDTAGANRYFEMAAQYPQYFYGQLSLERLGRPIRTSTPAPPPLPPRRSARRSPRCRSHGRCATSLVTPTGAPASSSTGRSRIRRRRRKTMSSSPTSPVRSAAATWPSSWGRAPMREGSTSSAKFHSRWCRRRRARTGRWSMP